jgi:hypothetical protein
LKNHRHCYVPIKSYSSLVVFVLIFLKKKSSDCLHVSGRSSQVWLLVFFLLQFCRQLISFLSFVSPLWAFSSFQDVSPRNRLTEYSLALLSLVSHFVSGPYIPNDLAQDKATMPRQDQFRRSVEVVVTKVYVAVLLSHSRSTSFPDLTLFLPIPHQLLRSS